VHWVNLTYVPSVEEIIFNGITVIGKALNVMRADVPFLLIVSG